MKLKKDRVYFNTKAMAYRSIIFMHQPILNTVWLEHFNGMGFRLEKSLTKTCKGEQAPGFTSNKVLGLCLCL